MNAKLTFNITFCIGIEIPYLGNEKHLYALPLSIIQSSRLRLSYNNGYNLSKKCTNN